jgi:hypothetical protein
MKLGGTCKTVCSSLSIQTSRPPKYTRLFITGSARAAATHNNSVMLFVLYFSLFEAKTNRFTMIVVNKICDAVEILLFLIVCSHTDT